MNLQLARSRELFFQRTNEPRTSYWSNPRVLASADPAARGIPKELADWNPLTPNAQSNCPLLHRTMEYLVKAVDPRWRARSKNLFAGRTFANDDIAMTVTSKNRDGAFIAISDEFSRVLFAYVSMWEKYLQAADIFAANAPTSVLAAEAEMRREFDNSIEAFREGGLAALSGTFLTFVRAGRSKQAIEDWCWHAEAWTVAHELSHQIALDHQKKRSEDAVRYLHDVKRGSQIEDWLVPHNVSHRVEFDADLMATMIVAKEQSEHRGSPGAKHIAITASTIALIAIAHYRDEWDCEPHEGSHPGVMDRIDHLLTIFCERSGHEGVGPKGADEMMSLYQLAGTLRAYADWSRRNLVRHTDDRVPALAAIVLNRVHFHGVANGERPGRIGV